MTKEITKVTVNDIRKEAKAQQKPKKAPQETKKQKPISIIKQDDLKPQEAPQELAGTIDDYLFSYIPQKHKDSITAIYKEGRIYTAVLTNGKTVTNITNWDSFKRAIRRAIEG